MSTIRAFWKKYEKSGFEKQKDTLKETYDTRVVPLEQTLTNVFAGTPYKQNLERKLSVARGFAGHNDYLNAVATLDDLDRDMHTARSLPALDAIWNPVANFPVIPYDLTKKRKEVTDAIESWDLAKTATAL